MEYGNYKLIIEYAVPECKECAQELAFLWAYQTVISRAYPYHEHVHKFLLGQGELNDENQKKPGLALFPVIDYINHKNYFEWKGYERPQQNQLLQHYDGTKIAQFASENFHQGEQIFRDYGNKSNARLLVDFGFMMFKNQHEAFDLETYVPNTKCPKDAKALGRGCTFVIHPGVFNVDLFNYLSATKSRNDKFTETHIPGLIKYRAEIDDKIYYHSGIGLREAVRRAS